MEQRKIQIGACEYLVRKMKKEDFPQVMNILRKAEWMMGQNTPYTWYEFYSKGWIVAVNKSDEVLGLCCAIKISDELYYIDDYIVKEAYRGMGIGSKIWNTCMDYINPGTACLYASKDMTEKYCRNGFSFVYPERFLNYKTNYEIKTDILSSEVPDGVSIVSFQAHHLKDILKYDSLLGWKNPRRQHFIELNCKEENTTTLVAFKNGTCVGFGTMKLSISNIPYMAPMYADDFKIAEALLKRLLEYFPLNRGLALYACDANAEMKSIMNKINCPKEHDWYQLYTRKVSLLNKSSLDKIYALYEFDFPQ